MRILYHHRTASKDGQAVHIEEMIGALRGLGHEVVVVCPLTTKAGDMGSDIGWVHRLKAALPRSLYELLELAYSVVAYRRLARAVRRSRPDIVYERYNLFMLAGVMIRRRFGLPLLLEVNAPLVHERSRFGGLALMRLAQWAEGLAWRRADAVLPVTNVLAMHVARRGVPQETIAVIPNGINAEHFDAAPEPSVAKAELGHQGALVLGFTGFVRDWHGVDRVVRWIASDRAPGNARLLIVGDGPARADLETLAAELGVSARVTFTGVVDRDAVPAHVAAFDIALQPAVVAYASPLKLFEYLALGKAIVAPRVPNIEEVLVDDVNGLLFDPAHEGALEAALSRLCADADLRTRLGTAAAATIVERNLTWVGNARRVEAIAERVIRQRQAEFVAERRVES